MYEWLIIFFGVVMLGLGIYMAVSPKSATEEKMRDDKKAVASMRIRGFLVMGCGVVICAIGILFKCFF